MTPSSGRIHRLGVQGTELGLSGCAWLVPVAGVVASGVLGGFGLWILGLLAAALLLWGLMLRQVSRATSRRALMVLGAVSGRRVLPSLWLPMRVPATTRVVGGHEVTWRVYAPVRADGRLATAEVFVRADCGDVSFFAWPADRAGPAHARHVPRLSLVVGGLVMASHDEGLVVAKLSDPACRASLVEVVPLDGFITVFTDQLWWRTQGAVSPTRLREAELGLLELARRLRAAP